MYDIFFLFMKFIFFIRMKWTTAHDEIFVIEMLSLESPVWEAGQGTQERSNRWVALATQLNNYTEHVFSVTARAVRDHYVTLVKNFKRKQANELKESGTVQTETDIDKGISEIVEKMEESDRNKMVEKEEKNKKLDEEIQQAKEMRDQSMESFAESRKRLCLKEDSEGGKRKRASASDAMSFLKEKSEAELPIKKEELELKKQEIELRREERQQELDLRRERDKQEMELRRAEIDLQRENLRQQAETQRQQADLQMQTMQMQFTMMQQMQQQMQQQNQFVTGFLSQQKNNDQQDSKKDYTNL